MAVLAPKLPEIPVKPTNKIFEEKIIKNDNKLGVTVVIPRRQSDCQSKNKITKNLLKGTAFTDTLHQKAITVKHFFSFFFFNIFKFETC